MKQVLLLVAAAILLFPTISNAQWTEITFHTNYVKELRAVGDTLYIGGHFTKTNGTSCYHFAKYDGVNVTSYPSNPGSSQGIFTMANFNGTLWMSCDYTLGSNWGIGYWDGTTWQDGGGTYYVGWEGSYVDGTDLYFGGFNGRVIKKSGTSAWTDLASTDSTQDQIWDINKFNNNIVIGGDMVTANSISIENICYYDGANWQPFGSGVDSTVYAIETMGSDLYVGGVFQNAGGTAAKYIAKWNGSSWSDVGGSVTGTGTLGVQDMMVYNNRLYVCGDFNEIGGVSTTGVVYWDGNNWNDLGFPALGSGYPISMEIYNSGLYVGTNEGYQMIDTSHVYMMPISGAGIEDVNVFSTLMIFPNPSTDFINIQTSAELKNVNIFDQAGRLVIIVNNVSAMYFQLDVAALEVGMYLIECETEEGISTQKFLKE
ncbi:MAG: T9SS type A sorting domain-containing protein [Crocinitomicaceae bacterium]|nr:T9SS type A sorting domain-containing protein [Crocinitomicaceae bacterium]